MFINKEKQEIETNMHLENRTNQVKIHHFPRNSSSSKDRKKISLKHFVLEQSEIIDEASQEQKIFTNFNRYFRNKSKESNKSEHDQHKKKSEDTAHQFTETKINHKKPNSLAFANRIITNFRVQQTNKQIQFRKNKFKEDPKTQLKLSLSFSKNRATSEGQLDQQKKSLGKIYSLKKQLSSSTERAMVLPHGKIKSKIKLSPKKKYSENNILNESQGRYLIESSNKQYKLRPVPLDNYLRFINGIFESQSYEIAFNFAFLRTLNKRQILDYVDFKNWKVIESILLCLVDIFKKEIQHSLPKKNHTLMKEYCILYLKIFQKSMMEVVLLQHYFKMFSQKLFLFFVRMRLYFFCLHQSLNHYEIFEKYGSIFQINCNLILDLFNTIYKGFQDIQKQLKKNFVIETFKSLKTSNQFERKNEAFEQQFQKMINICENYDCLRQILVRFKIFLDGNCELKHLQMQVLTQMQMVLNWQRYNIPPIPYLPKNMTKRRYTLVISINRVLISYNETTRLLKYRPYLDKFLLKMKDSFELVAFSTESKLFSDLIVDHIERNERVFSYRLYKEHMSFHQGHLIKDLNKIGRDLERTLIIDCDSKHFDNLEQNGIFIKEFVDNKQDKELLTVIEGIQKMMSHDPEDLTQLNKHKFQSLEHIQEVNQNTITINQQQ